MNIYISYYAKASKDAYAKNKKILTLALCLSILSTPVGQMNASIFKNFKAPTWKNNKSLIITFSLLAAYVAKNFIEKISKNDASEGAFLFKYTSIAALLYATSPIAFNFKYIHKPGMFIANVFAYPWAVFMAYKLSFLALNLVGFAIDEIEYNCKRISYWYGSKERIKAEQKEAAIRKKEEERIEIERKQEEERKETTRQAKIRQIEAQKKAQEEAQKKIMLEEEIARKEADERINKALVEKDAPIKYSDIWRLRADKKLNEKEINEKEVAELLIRMKDVPVTNFSYSDTTKEIKRVRITKLKVSEVLEIEELLCHNDLREKFIAEKKLETAPY